MTAQKDSISVPLDVVQAVEKLLKDTDIAKAVSQIEAIRRDYRLTGEKHFNFFTSILKNYKKENLHSDILKTILDPQTMGANNIDYLNCFVKLVTGSLKSVPDDIVFNVETTKVEREKGRIDVFIHDDKKCIIIENKINNAPDMDNQLPRYAEYAKMKGYQYDKIIAFVYIPPIGDKAKRPPFEQYSPENKKLIEAKFVPLPVLLPPDDDGLDLVRGFLDRIADFDNISNNGISPKELTARVYIHQYSNLLKGLEEDTMSNTSKLDILKKLFESRETAAEIADVWNNRSALFSEACERALEKKGFAKYACFGHFGKKIGDIGIYLQGDPPNYQFGFGAKLSNISANVQLKLRNILKNILEQGKFPKSAFTSIVPEKEGDIEKDGDIGWLWVEFNPDTLNDSLSEMIDKLVGCYEFLETEARSI